MRVFLTGLIFSLFSLAVHAQQDRFIYLQTENDQSFFVKLNDRVYNSLPSGYVIIPKLDDGTYHLVIGFPGNSSRQGFNCTVDQKDVGFIIKNTGEQLQLYNLQSRTTIAPTEVINKTEPVYETRTDLFSIMLAHAVNDSTILRKDIVSLVLDKPVVDSASLLATNNQVITKQDSTNVDSTQSLALNTAVTNNPLQTDSSRVIVKPEVIVNTSDSLANAAPITEKPVTKSDSLIANTEVSKVTSDTLSRTDIVSNDVKEIVPEKQNVTIADSSQNHVVPEVAVTKPSKKKRSKKDDNALKEPAVTNVVTTIIDTKTDTATVKPGETTTEIILWTKVKRRSKKNAKDGMEMVYTDNTGESMDTIRIFIPDESRKKEEVKVDVVTTIPEKETTADTTVNNKTDPVITKEEKEIIKEANKPAVSMINSDCKNFASEDDFLKVRKKMVAENSDEDMVKAAKKVFKTRCFTTEQIKNLSLLFLKDQGKYMFFDAAYPYVSDSERFPVLENQFAEDYYLNRFRAMIHK